MILRTEKFHDEYVAHVVEIKKWDNQLVVYIYWINPVYEIKHDWFTYNEEGGRDYPEDKVESIAEINITWRGCWDNRIYFTDPNDKIIHCCEIFMEDLEDITRICLESERIAKDVMRERLNEELED